MGLNLKKFKTNFEIYELILCKPNKQQIGILNDTIIDEIKLSYVGISSIKFKLPRYVVHNHEKMQTPHWDDVVGDYLLLVNGDMYFMVSQPEVVIDANKKEYKSFQCYSLEHELNKRTVRNYDSTKVYSFEGIWSEDYSNELFREVLPPDRNNPETGEFESFPIERMPILNYLTSITTWNIGYVNPKFLAKRRTFAFTEATIYAIMKEVQMSYNCLFTFDTLTKTIDVLDIDEYSVDSGILITESSYIKSFKEKFDHDSLVTRLKVYGKDDITLRDYNPLGTTYLEDYSYYKNLKYMNQELIDALEVYEALVESKEPEIISINNQIDALYSGQTASSEEVRDINLKLARIAELEKNIFNWERDVTYFDLVNRKELVTGVDLKFGPYYGHWGANEKYENGLLKQEFIYQKNGSLDKISLNPNLGFDKWANSQSFKAEVDAIIANGGAVNNTEPEHFPQEVHNYILSVKNQSDYLVKIIEYLATNQQYRQNYIPSIDTNGAATLHYTTLINQASGELSNLKTEVGDGSEYGLYGKYNKIKNELDTLTYKRDVFLTYPDRDSGINAEISNLNNRIYNLEADLRTAESLLEVSNDDIAVLVDAREVIVDLLKKDNNFTHKQLIDLDYFVREATWTDNNYFNAKDLYEEAKERMQYLSQPAITFDIDVVSLMEMMGNKYNANYLELGDCIYVRHEATGNDYKVRLVGYTHRPVSNKYALTFTNKDSLSDSAQYLEDLLKNAKTAATTVDMSKFKWDKAQDNETEINTILDNEWNAAKNAVVSGPDQEVRVDQTGITIKDATDANQNEQLRMINNVIAMTTNNWATADLAITPKGVYAKKLIGEILAGNNLTITGAKYDELGNPTTNTVTIDGDGFNLVGSEHNGVTINSEVGLQIDNATSGVQVALNGQDGFKISKNGVNKLHLDADGNVVLSGGVITWGNDVNAPSKGDLGGWTTYIDDNGIYTGTLTADKVVTGTLGGPDNTITLGANVVVGADFKIQWEHLSPTAQENLKGADGVSYNWTKYVYKRATTKPAVPALVVSPTGWTTSIPAGESTLWMAVATINGMNGSLLGTWSDPVLFEGAIGPVGPIGPQGPSGSDGADGPAGSDANVPSWVSEWNGNATEISGGYIVSPKIWAGEGGVNASGVKIDVQGLRSYTGGSLNGPQIVPQETGMFIYRDNSNIGELDFDYSPIVPNGNSVNRLFLKTHGSTALKLESAQDLSLHALGGTIWMNGAVKIDGSLLLNGEPVGSGGTGGTVTAVFG